MRVDLMVDCLWNFFSSSLFFSSNFSIFFKIRLSFESIMSLSACVAPASILSESEARV